jgi:uncharacterized DUF497 family protein
VGRGEKAATNLDKHGIGFDEAAAALDDVLDETGRDG